MRVLLADESSSIKKVIQLALQDMGVEIKTVHLGVDVPEVSRQFFPDIIFADVLLQKRNGYETCSDLKQDSQLQQIPVVLMWSSFMELDQQKFRECGANGQLEKPFDVDDLRSLVINLVPKLRNNPVSSYIGFAPALKMEMQEETHPPAASQPRTAPPQPSLQQQGPSQPPFFTPPPPSTSANAGQAKWSMEDFDDVQDFAQSVEPTSVGAGFHQEQNPEGHLSLDHSAFGTADSSHEDLPQFEMTSQELSSQKSSEKEISDPFKNFRLDLNDDNDEDFVIADFSQDQPLKKARESREDQESSLVGKAGTEAYSSLLDRDLDDELPTPLRSTSAGTARPKGLDAQNSTLNENFHSHFSPEENSQKPQAPQFSNANQQLLQNELERIIQEQLPQILEAALKKVLPEITANILTEQIDKVAAEIAKKSSGVI